MQLNVSGEDFKNVNGNKISVNSIAIPYCLMDSQQAKV